MRTFLFVLFFPCLLFSQSMPEAYDLIDSSYSFTEWSALKSAGTYPPSMIFHCTSTLDHDSTAEMTSDWTYPYNLTSNARFNGLGDRGISFVNTADTQDGLGYHPAAVVIALNTHGMDSIRISWTARTLYSAPRRYVLAFQTKRDLDSNYINHSDFTYYARESGDSSTFTFDLPYYLNNYGGTVYLRWFYYHLEGDEMRRCEIGLDEIHIEGINLSSIELKEPGELTISPNPASDYIDINFMAQGSYDISLIDIFGNQLTLYEGVKYGRHNHRIDVANYSAGVYFLKITTADKVFVDKILIR